MAQPDAPRYGNNWSDEAKRLRRFEEDHAAWMTDPIYRTAYRSARKRLEEADAARPDPVLPDVAGSVDPGVDLGMVECE